MGFRLGVDTSIELGHIAAVPLTAENWRGFQSQRALVKDGYRADVDGDRLAAVLREALPNLTEHKADAEKLLEVIRA
jgi:hypothetical protein